MAPSNGSWMVSRSGVAVADDSPRARAAIVEALADHCAGGGIVCPADMHLAAEQQGRDGHRFLAQLLRHGFIKTDILRTAGELQRVQFHPRSLLRNGLDIGMRFGAMRTGQRPEEIQLHLGLPVGAGFDPVIVGMADDDASGIKDSWHSNQPSGNRSNKLPERPKNDYVCTFRAQPRPLLSSMSSPPREEDRRQTLLAYRTNLKSKFITGS